jgi:hypothetical protein
MLSLLKIDEHPKYEVNANDMSECNTTGNILVNVTLRYVRVTTAVV